MNLSRRGLLGLFGASVVMPSTVLAKPKALAMALPLYELEFAEVTTFQRYAGYTVLNITPSDVFAAAEFDWKPAIRRVKCYRGNGKTPLNANGRS